MRMNNAIKVVKEICILLYYLPGFIWKPAIHYKIKENRR